VVRYGSGAARCGPVRLIVTPSDKNRFRSVWSTIPLYLVAADFMQITNLCNNYYQYYTVQKSMTTNNDCFEQFFRLLLPNSITTHLFIPNLIMNHTRRRQISKLFIFLTHLTHSQTVRQTHKSDIRFPNIRICHVVSIFSTAGSDPPTDLHAKRLKRRVFTQGCAFCSKIATFYRAMHFSAKRGIAIACRLSVCPSVRLFVCPSVCDVGEL